MNNLEKADSRYLSKEIKVNNLKRDLEFNKGLLSISVLVTYRFGNWIFYNVNVPVIKQILWLIYKIMDFIFVRVVSSAEIPAQTKIGAGLKLPHGANGVLIHPRAVLGDNVMLFHQVTIGVNFTAHGTDKYGPPTIGNNVIIGAGAKIIGSPIVGNNARIGANAVIVRDVPENKTAVGVPGQLK